MRSTTPLYITPPHYCLTRARVNSLHGRGFALQPHCRPISAIGFLQGYGMVTLHPSLQLDRYKRPPSLYIRAAAKGKKPPPKPASRTVILGAIFLPLGMAGSAVLAGRILLKRIKKEAMEEAEELERRFNPSRLLPDGKTDEERQLERESLGNTESANMPSIRNRPKREE
ncbi:hypothetical protein GOP47_0028996 [Adiantum capillus-veneris]|nr:hypothetical protein GOP47_0028996 [Adiantum capillus-veneris]